MRAKIRRAGPFSLRHDTRGEPSDGRPVLWPVIALDGDAGGAPRRPRLLCEDDDVRLAVYMDASDLGTVALAGTVIGAAPSAAQVAADAPGVHLAPGALVETLGTDHASARVHYHGLFLDAVGDVPRDHLDVVYAAAKEPTPYAIDAVLTRNVELRAAPAGRVLARIDEPTGVDNELDVKRLGAPVRGFVRVRYDEIDAYAIGWVPADAVQRIAATAGGIGSGTGFSAGWTSDAVIVRAPRGALLTDPASNAIVGVVTADHAFTCSADCNAPAPLVEVEGCAGRVAARVRLPR